MSDVDRLHRVLNEEPTASAELRIEVDPEGRSSLAASLPAANASDLLPLTGIVACAVGPALALWPVDLAGVPFWTPLAVVIFQLCGIVTLVKHKRT